MASTPTNGNVNQWVDSTVAPHTGDSPSVFHADGPLSSGGEGKNPTPTSTPGLGYTYNAPDVDDFRNRRRSKQDLDGTQPTSDKLALLDGEGGKKKDTDGDDGTDTASLESDFYYDDAGKAHTYYRPRRYPHHKEQGDEAKHNHHHVHVSAPVSAKAYPENNGSIYIAPPSAQNHPTHHDQHNGTPANRNRRGSRQSLPTASRASTVADVDDNDDAVSLATVTTHQKGEGDDDDNKSVIDNKSILNMPNNLHRIARKIEKLPTDEMLYLSGMLSRKAHREVYSVLQYSGEAWYLPEIRRCRPDEGRWSIKYSRKQGLIVAIAGRRLRIRLLSYFIRLCIIALIWFTVWQSTAPKSWSYRGGYFLDPYVIVLVSAIIGGMACRILQIPPLVGILWMGIMWNNIGPEVGYLTSGILPQVRTISGRSGLAVIVLRAGWSINPKAVLPLIKNVLFGFTAMIAEIIVHAMMAQYYLEYNDWKWAFCQAIVNAVPGAAIVVGGVLLLQADGYSRASGPLPLMMASIAFDAPIAVWASSFTDGLITSDKEISFLAGMTPVQIIGGIAAGAAGAVVVHCIVWLIRHEADRLPTGKFTEGHLQNVKWMAVFFLFMIGNGMLYLAYDIEMAGAGIVAAICMAFFTSFIWSKDEDPEWLETKRDVGAGLGQIWDLVGMPCLFAIAGSNIVLSRIFNKTIFPKALLIVVVCSVTRMVFTFWTSVGLGFTMKERIYHSVSAMSKATVQIAMGSGPLIAMAKKIAAIDQTADPAKFAEAEVLLERAYVFQSVCVLFALICAPISAIWIIRMGPTMLRRE